MNAANPAQPEIIHADNDVKELSKAGLAIIAKVMDVYESLPEVTLHETLHGHMATIHRPSNRYVPGSEGQPARMTREDARFLYSLGGGLRWFEMYTDRILLGIDSVVATACSR